MTLASRLTPAGAPADDPEDFFEDALGVVFDDDAKNLRECGFLISECDITWAPSLHRGNKVTSSMCLSSLPCVLNHLSHGNLDWRF